MLKRKTDERIYDYWGRMVEDDRKTNHMLSKMVHEAMEKQGVEKIVDINDYDLIDTFDGLKFVKIKEVYTLGIVRNKFAVIRVELKIYDEREDMVNDVPEREVSSMFIDLPRRFQLFIMRNICK